MTPFALLCQLAGLSQREASDYLKISPSSVDKMARGVRKPLASLLDDLRELIKDQDNAARVTLALCDPKEIELVYPANDAEARALGWPCVGACRAMIARVVANADVPVILKPYSL